MAQPDLESPAATHHGWLEGWLHGVQRVLLFLLLGCYVLGALVPAPGVALRGLTLGMARFGESRLDLSAPLWMLAFLLFNAGFGSRVDELRHVVRRPKLLALGLGANVAAPVIFAFLMVALLRLWPEPDETQNILVGLALISAMPIAGASTAWSQNANGNLALSLGLVLASTVLSPLLTPLVLESLATVATGDYAEDLRLLAHSGTQLFLATAVVLPSLLGIAVRAILPPTLARKAMPLMKLANLVVLLVLNYSNAALALPQVLRSPDLDFLALVIGIVALLCAGAFWVGARIARACGGDRADATALMFALGMNNNGTGLVLASTALSDHPAVTVPILAYNLVQQIAAGLVDAAERARRRAL